MKREEFGDFPGIDLEWIQYILERVDVLTLKMKLKELSCYPRDLKLSGNALKNYKLLQLISRFPQTDVLLLKSYITENKSIHEISDILLKSKPKTTKTLLDETYLFRDYDYLLGSRAQLLNEFPGHWKSTVSNVLIETNDYIKAKKVLKGIKVGFWSSFWNLIPRRKIEIIELQNMELQEQIHAEIREIQENNDKNLALEINKEQYSSLNQNLSCQCCFDGFSWEEMGSCSSGHLFCGACILEFVNQSLFGSSSLAGKEVECVFMGSGCNGKFKDLQKFVPENLLKRYNAMLTQKEVEISGISLFKCPFCTYSEEYIPEKGVYLTVKRWISNTILNYEKIKKLLPMASFLVSFLATVYLNPRNLLFTFFFSVYLKKKLENIDFKRIVRRLKDKIQEKYLVFNCKQCLKPSCVNCCGEWEVSHVCHEKEKSSFRLFIENRMSEALLRTCPNCKISFSKSDGCNKITVFYQD